MTVRFEWSGKRVRVTGQGPPRTMTDKQAAKLLRDLGPNVGWVVVRVDD